MRVPSAAAALLLLLSPLLSSAVAQDSSSDTTPKFWPPGQGPPSRSSLDALVASYRNNASLAAELALPARVLKKMSADASEKFFDHYWSWEEHVLGFGDDDDAAEGWELRTREYSAPARWERAQLPGWAIFRRASFSCSSDSFACTSIGRPNVCCTNGETCNLIADTGHGDVGCCPNGMYNSGSVSIAQANSPLVIGQVCSGALTGCSANQKTCPSSEGGGCCNDGTVCSPNGCIAAAAITTSVAQGTTVTTTAAAAVATTCPAGSYLCPNNVAGGCCPSGRLCGVTDCPTPIATLLTATACPTGYYTCAPSASGGCCQNGRACGITDCPPLSTTVTTAAPLTTTITAGGVTTTTIVGGIGGLVPVTTGVQMTGIGVCATGWSACGDNIGGGCCPQGYDCAQNNCPAKTVTAVGTIAGGTGGVVTIVTTLPATQKEPLSSLTPNAAPTGWAGSSDVRKVVVAVGVVVGVVV